MIAGDGASGSEDTSPEEETATIPQGEIEEPRQDEDQSTEKNSGN